jgi:endonuclease/exonuclease/phosphatase family metal-dependent hydrolase
VALKILTLNLWHDAGDWPARSKLVRQWIDRLDPDLIAFQEALRLPGFDQVEALLAGRAMHLDYVKASKFWKKDREHEAGDVGNALASRWPIVDREAVVLPASPDGERRAALSATVDAPFGPVGFTVTHLNWRLHHGVVREQQVQAVCELALRRAPRGGFPPVMAGDFNAEPESAEIRYVTGHQSLDGESVCFLDCWARAGDPGHSGVTWANRNPHARGELEPDRRIDYVFVGLPKRGGLGQILGCRVVCDEEDGGVWPSDHFGVFAELRSEPS